MGPGCCPCGKKLSKRSGFSREGPRVRTPEDTVDDYRRDQRLAINCKQEQATKQVKLVQKPNKLKGKFILWLANPIEAANQLRKTQKSCTGSAAKMHPLAPSQSTLTTAPEEAFFSGNIIGEFWTLDHLSNRGDEETASDSSKVKKNRQNSHVGYGLPIRED